jgi:hypothetical protein
MAVGPCCWGGWCRCLLVWGLMAGGGGTQCTEMPRSPMHLVLNIKQQQVPRHCCQPGAQRLLPACIRSNIQQWHNRRHSRNNMQAHAAPNSGTAPGLDHSTLLAAAMQACTGQPPPPHLACLPPLSVEMDRSIAGALWAAARSSCSALMRSCAASTQQLTSVLQ